MTLSKYKKVIKIFIVIFAMFFIIPNVNAECTYIEKARLNEIAANIKTNYEVFKNGNWYELKPKEPLRYIMIVYMLAPNSTAITSVSWELGYGKLPSGKYRIIKDFLDGPNEKRYYVACEFEIKRG